MLQFWALASLNEDTRRTAARAIVEQLAEANCRGADTEGGGGQREQKVSYTLKRLVRGLQSSRDGARQGYCLALTEILCSYEEVLPQRVLDMVAEFMVISGSVKGQEERDVFFGRIFACMALIRSARLGAEDSRRVAELLVGAAGKAFLREISVELLGTLASQRGFDAFETELLPVLSGLLGDPTSTDSVSLVAKLRHVFPSRCPATNCPTLWNATPLTHPSNLSTIVGALKSSTSNHPHIHVVWNYILHDLGGTEEGSSGGGTAAHLAALWRTVVEAELLTSTHERRYLAFELFCRLASATTPAGITGGGGGVGGGVEGGGGECKVTAVAGASAAVAQRLKILLSPRFVQCLGNNLSSKSNYLYTAAQRCLACVRAAARSDGGKHRLDVVIAILSAHLHFDRLSNTKLVAEELARLPVASLVAFRQFLYSVFDGSATIGGRAGADSQRSEEDVEKRQLWAVGQVFSLAKIQNADEPLQLSLLYFLQICGFYQLQGKLTKQARGVVAHAGLQRSHGDITPAARDLCRQRFYSLLQHLVSQSSSTTTTTRRGPPGGAAAKAQGDGKAGGGASGAPMDGMMSCGSYWASRAVEYGQELLACKNVSLERAAVGGESDSVTASSIDALAAISQRKGTHDEHELRRLRGFEYLIANMLLLQLNEPTQTTEVLGDAVECFARIGEMGEQAHDREDSQPITVLIDCLLSLLTKPSALVRASDSNNLHLRSESILLYHVHFGRPLSILPCPA